MTEKEAEILERLMKIETELEVLRVGYETIFHACEINGLLVAGEPVKAQPSQTAPTSKPTWDPSKIKWTTAEGAKGPYEKSEDVDNLEFKAMLKDLAAHQGKMSRGGYFYWVFQSGSIVGRKRRAKA